MDPQEEKLMAAGMAPEDIAGYKKCMAALGPAGGAPGNMTVGDKSPNQKGQKGEMEFEDAWDRPSRHATHSAGDVPVATAPTPPTTPTAPMSEEIEGQGGSANGGTFDVKKMMSAYADDPKATPEQKMFAACIKRMSEEVGELKKQQGAVNKMAEETQKKDEEAKMAAFSADMTVRCNKLIDEGRVSPDEVAKIVKPIALNIFRAKTFSAESDRVKALNDHFALYASKPVNLAMKSQIASQKAAKGQPLDENQAALVRKGGPLDQIRPALAAKMRGETSVAAAK